MGNPHAVRALKELVRLYRPNVVFLMETLVHSVKIEEIRIQLGFNGTFLVDKEGRGGGLANLWKVSVVVNIYGYSSHFIDMII